MLTERGGALTERGGVLTERGGALTERGGVLTKKGGVLTERDGALTVCVCQSVCMYVSLSYAVLQVLPAAWLQHPLPLWYR